MDTPMVCGDCMFASFPPKKAFGECWKQTGTFMAVGISPKSGACGKFKMRE